MPGLLDHPLSWMERTHIRVAQRTLEPGAVDRLIRFGHRHVTAPLLRLETGGRLRAIGLDRLPPLERERSYLLVCNHRTFYDLHWVTSHLVTHTRFRHRLLFPVRAPFFYDHPLGLLVNGAVSLFAMYPPVFRDPARVALNQASLHEIIRLLGRGGFLVGVHPEGTRNRGDDPYALLPPQSGVGRIVHAARVTVLPVFVNGISQHAFRELIPGTAVRRVPVIAVFGAPVALDDLLAQPGNARVFGAISRRAMEAIAALGEEEKEARCRLDD